MTVARKSLSHQCGHVLDYLEYHFPGGITSKDAWNALGISRLSARIGELRHEHGYEIKGRMIRATNREGKICHVKLYWLVRT